MSNSTKTLYKISHTNFITKVSIARETKTLYILENGYRINKQSMLEVGSSKKYYSNKYKLEITENDIKRHNIVLNKNKVYNLKNSLDYDIEYNDSIMNLVNSLLEELQNAK